MFFSPPHFYSNKGSSVTVSQGRGWGGRNGEVKTLSRSNSNHTTKDVHNGGPSLSPENCEIKEFKDHQLETRVTPHDPFSIK